MSSEQAKERIRPTSALYYLRVIESQSRSGAYRKAYTGRRTQAR